MTIPVVGLTATTDPILLHVPPVVASLSTTVLPAHTFEGPDIAAGKARTINTPVTTQPAPNI